MGYFNPALGIFLGNQRDGFLENDGFVFWPINVPFLQKLKCTSSLVFFSLRSQESLGDPTTGIRASSHTDLRSAEMSRHGETTSQAGGRSSVNVDIAYVGTPRVTGEAAISASVPMLSKLNYPMWAMRMEVILEAYSFLGAIEDENVLRKLDR